MKRIMRRVWWSKLRRKALWLWLAILVSSFIAGCGCAIVLSDWFFFQLGLAATVLVFLVGGVLLTLKHFNPMVKADPETLSEDGPDVFRRTDGLAKGCLSILIGVLVFVALLAGCIDVVLGETNLTRELVLTGLIMAGGSWFAFFFGLFVIRISRLGFLPTQQ